MSMGSDVGVDPLSESIGWARGLEKDDVLLDE